MLIKIHMSCFFLRATRAPPAVVVAKRGKTQGHTILFKLKKKNTCNNLFIYFFFILKRSGNIAKGQPPSAPKQL